MCKPTYDKLNPPRVLGSEVMYDDFVRLRRDTLLNAQGQSYLYYTLETKSSAAIVLAEVSTDVFVVNREYRHPTQQFLLSLPGGYLDEGEEPCAGAARELLEETGYRAASFTCLGSAYPYPGLSDQKLYYIFAQGAYAAQATAHETGELMTTSLMSYEELLSAFREGVAVDGTLFTALFLHRYGRSPNA